MSTQSLKISSKHPLSDSRVRNLVAICLVALTVSIAISFLKYSSFIRVNISRELLPVYHTAFSIALLIGLAGLYYHASKFYSDSFYLFIAIGWLLNLAYILFINTSLGREDLAGRHFRSLTLLLALLSDLPFYLAGRTTPNQSAKYRDLLLPIGVICIWAVVYFFPIDPLTKNRVHIVVAICFATYVSFLVYLSFRLRISDENLASTDPPEVSDDGHSRSTFPHKLLLYDFFALAVIQLSFVFVLFESTRAYIIHLLYFALFLKIANAYALTVILREDYGNIRASAERNEEQLRQERQERSEFQEIGLLTASIEHELRTPLGVLRSKLNDMGREYQHIDSVVADVQFLQTQRERLLNATKIITILRAGQEFFNKRLTAVNLAHLARSAVKDLRKEYDLKDIHFKYEERVGQPLAIAHPQLLAQAVINILKNAVEAIHSVRSKGGEIVIVITKSKASNRFLVIEITDNGPGFPEGSMEKLTQPDFSTKIAERPNRGLGLFVSERIIKLHNGIMEFGASEEGGAVVSLCIPRALTQKEIKSGSGKEESGALGT